MWSSIASPRKMIRSLQQPAVDVVGALAAARGLDDHRARASRRASSAVSSAAVGERRRAPSGCGVGVSCHRSASCDRLRRRRPPSARPRVASSSARRRIGLGDSAARRPRRGRAAGPRCGAPRRTRDARRSSGRRASRRPASGAAASGCSRGRARSRGSSTSRSSRWRPGSRVALDLRLDRRSSATIDASCVGDRAEHEQHLDPVLGAARGTPSRSAASSRSVTRRYSS